MIAVCVPTKGRPEKLKNFLDSLPDIPVYIYHHSDDKESFPKDNHNIYFGDLSIIKANNFLIKKAYQDNHDVSILVATDDIIYEPECITNVQKAVDEDDTKLYGLKCLNMVCNDDAYVCISNEIVRETGGSPYNEEYYHFYADTELGETYKAKGKFEKINAEYTNMHPSVTGNPDDTHTHNRSYKLIHDKGIYENRNLLHR